MKKCMVTLIKLGLTVIIPALIKVHARTSHTLYFEMTRITDYSNVSQC